MAKQTKEEQVSALYLSKYKPLKLPSAYVRGLKAVMLTAARKRGAGKKEINAAAKAYLKEKDTKKKPDKAKAKPKAVTTSAKVKVPAKKAKVAKVDTEDIKAKVKKAKVDKNDPAQKALAKMPQAFSQVTEATLRSIAHDLNIKLRKGATIEVMRDQVSDVITALNPAIEKVLKDIDRSNITDCLGLFIDLSTASCISCSKREECLVTFQRHVDNGFEDIPRITLAEITVDEVAAEVSVEDVPDSPTEDEDENEYLTKYTGKREILVYGETFDDDDEMFDLQEAVKNEMPEDVKSLGRIILRYFDPADNTKAGKKALIVFTTNVLIELDCVELA